MDNNHNNNEYQNPYENNISIQPTGPSNLPEQDTDLPDGKETNKKEPKQKFATKKTMAVMVILCILFSSMLGFGGGVLASQFAKTSGSGVTIKSAESPSTTQTSVSGTPAATVAASVGNCVVEITTESVATGSMMRQFVTEGAGSGVIISEDGYIITNNHVIDGANKTTVTLKDGTTYDAKLIATDSKTDIALLKVEASGLDAAVFGDSSKLEVGQTAIAIGNPLGQLGGTVTSGIISALNRDITIEGETMNLLQTDAAINPGNSGGGLFNENGELIGLVVAKSTGEDVEGLGFAIPSELVKSVVSELSEYGYVRGRVELSMSLINVNTTQMAMMYRLPQTGVYVSKIESGSSAEKAGFQVGDCIISVNSTAVSTEEEVNTIVDKSKVGDTLSIVVLRNNQKMTLDLTLEEYTPNTAK